MTSKAKEEFIRKPVISRTEHEYQVKDVVPFPANIRLCENIGWGEKCFLAELTAISDKEGYTPYSAKGLSKLLKVSLPTISQWIKDLCAKGIIELGVKQIEDKWYNFIKLNKLPG